jgi:hypothetical protein
MARLLSCPHCHADFGFDDWAKATSCPACGRRLSFFEASAQAGPAAAAAAAPTAVPTATVAPAPAPPVVPTPAPPVVPAAAPAAPAVSCTQQSPWPPAASMPPTPALEAPAAPFSAALVSAAPVSAAPAPAAPAPAASAVPNASVPITVTFPAGPRRHVYTIGGKALQWSPGWTVVLVIWTVVAVGLAATRIDMGRLTVMTPAESAAIAAVQKAKLSSGASTEAVLRYSATHKLTLEGHVAAIPAGGTQMWYAFDRPWEHRVYVYSELPGGSLVGNDAVLSWSVSSGVAAADGSTRAALSKAAQIMAHPPSPNSVPAVPGIIPSIPPDLQ